MNSASPTDALRALHIPAEPSWWPPAAGWWIVIALLLLILFVAAWGLRKVRRERRWKKIALTEYQKISTLSGDSEAIRREQLQRCSILLRRIGMALQPRATIAATTGEQWLTQLDSISNTTAYTLGVGRLLVDAPYRIDATSQSDLRALLALVENTIRRAQKRTAND